MKIEIYKKFYNINDDFFAFLELLIEKGYYEENTVSSDILKKIVEDNHYFNGLSDRQADTFFRYAIAPYAFQNDTIKTCLRCNKTIEWNEMIDTIENDCYCHKCFSEKQ